MAPVHLEFFESVSEIAQAKAEILQGLVWWQQLDRTTENPVDLPELGDSFLDGIGPLVGHQLQFHAGLTGQVPEDQRVTLVHDGEKSLGRGFGEIEDRLLMLVLAADDQLITAEDAHKTVDSGARRFRIKNDECGAVSAVRFADELFPHQAEFPVTGL